MKITVLVDNTANTRNLKGEGAFALYAEDEGLRLLFDMGYSSLMLSNAACLGINVNRLTHIVLSHGHYDHTWGLAPFLEQYQPSGAGKPLLLAHPLAFSRRVKNGLEMGIAVTEPQLKQYFTVQTSRQPVWLTERLVFLGEISRRTNFEGQLTIGDIFIDGKPQPDCMSDDSALVYKGKNGLTIITGCSHSGICNICEQAKAVCDDQRIHLILGGLHLRKPSAKQLRGTVAYLQQLGLSALYAGHCTDLPSRIALSQLGVLEEMHVGLSLELS